MRVCEYCGDSLDGKRADARFCGVTCRSTAFRERSGARRALARFEALLDEEGNVDARAAYEALCRDVEGFRDGNAEILSRALPDD